MFKLGGKKLFVLCLLVKNVSAVYSADRCDFSIAAVTGSGQVHMGARLMTHKILYQLAFRAKMIHLPS